MSKPTQLATSTTPCPRGGTHEWERYYPMAWHGATLAAIPGTFFRCGKCFDPGFPLPMSEVPVKVGE